MPLTFCSEIGAGENGPGPQVSIANALRLAPTPCPCVSTFATLERNGGGRDMATYERLTSYLTLQRADEITLDLGEIESIIRASLPMSARKRPQYWANVVKEEQRSPPNRAAKAAGFSAFLIPTMQKVRFVRD